MYEKTTNIICPDISSQKEELGGTDMGREGENKLSKPQPQLNITQRQPQLLLGLKRI